MISFEYHYSSSASAQSWPSHGSKLQNLDLHLNCLLIKGKCSNGQSQDIRVIRSGERFNTITESKYIRNAAVGHRLVSWLWRISPS
jgi:hypothetical protein